MSKLYLIVGLSTITSSCAPQKVEERRPKEYSVPLFYAAPEEVHPACTTETVYCTYYSDYKPLLVYRCRDAQGRPSIYALNKNRFGEDRLYKSKLRQDINNQTFSEYCKSTFENYRWFMEETETGTRNRR